MEQKYTRSHAQTQTNTHVNRGNFTEFNMSVHKPIHKIHRNGKNEL